MHAKSDDAEISYSVLGEGPDLVLLHPFPSNHGYWFPVAEALALRYRVTLLDLRGQGASTLGSGPATMDKQAADVLAVCRDVGISKAVFGGASIGGYILFEFWRKYRDQVRGLFFCNTRAASDTEEARAGRLKSAEEVLEKGTRSFFDSMLSKVLGESTTRNRPDLVDATRRMMRHSPQAIAAIQHGMAQRIDSSPTLNTITVPTLFIAGEEDIVTPIAEMQHMAQQVSSSIFRPIPLAGHFAALEKSQEVTKVIRNFLDGLGQV